VEFVRVLSWVSMGQEDWRSSPYFVLPVVDPYLFLSKEFSSSRGGDFEGF
ncbi:hypothetical protein A2U01_0110011, partial [Trifolium medium]|nr:hypothetical protein [Trifolium medium]